MGLIWFHKPVPGLRKSGMPDSVLMPAPVKKTIRCASASRAASCSTLSSKPGIPLLLKRDGLV